MSKKYPLYQLIATVIDSREASRARGNHTWKRKWHEKVEEFLDLLPRGSGFDAAPDVELVKVEVEPTGTELHPRTGGAPIEVLVFNVPYHPMDQHGGYESWVHYTFEVWPCLRFGFNIRNVKHDAEPTRMEVDEDFNFLVNDTAEYVAEIYGEELSKEYFMYPEQEDK